MALFTLGKPSIIKRGNNVKKHGLKWLEMRFGPPLSGNFFKAFLNNGLLLVESIWTTVAPLIHLCSHDHACFDIFLSNYAIFSIFVLVGKMSNVLASDFNTYRNRKNGRSVLYAAISIQGPRKKLDAWVVTKKKSKVEISIRMIIKIGWKMFAHFFDVLYLHMCKTMSKHFLP